MNRLYKSTGLVTVTVSDPTPIVAVPTISSFPFTSPSLPLHSSPVGTSVAPSTGGDVMHPSDGTKVEACITSDGNPGFLLVELYKDGTFKILTECMAAG